jgi:uncharacterized short protein YbdD (DUF466 family)
VTHSIGRFVRTIKRVAGMPDYEAYVDHLRAVHPDCTIASERDYYDLYLRGRYDGKATRCC